MLPFRLVQSLADETDVAMDQEFPIRKSQAVKKHLKGRKVMRGFPQGKQISPMLLMESFFLLD